MSTDNSDESIVWTKLPLRTVNALERAGVTTLTQPGQLSHAELTAIDGIGKVDADLVRRQLGRLIDAGHSTKSA